MSATRTISLTAITTSVAVTWVASSGGGEIRVQLCDDNGAAIPGFTFADCTAIKDDGVALPVRWKKPLSKLRDRTVQLEFRLTNARIYAFDK